jgi:DNA-binding CsgD family transcriptional regulator
MNNAGETADSTYDNDATALCPAAANFAYWQVWDALAHPESAACDRRGAMMAALRGDLRRELGRAEAAADACDRRGDAAGGARARVNAGLARLHLGDPAGAAADLTLAGASARRHGARWEEGYATFALGTLHRYGRRPDAAAARFEAAGRIFADGGDLHGYGYARHGLGIALAAGGAAGSARAHLLAALDAFRRVGARCGMLATLRTLAALDEAAGDAGPGAPAPMEAPRERTRALLTVGAHNDAAPGRPRRGAARTAPRNAGPGAVRAGVLQALTRREREVAGLLAAGLTNRQIGERMIIAERTVDTHVQRILAKLNCATRVQVAVLVAAGP